MATEPILELQGAIVTALKAYAPLVTLVGTRIFDRVENNALLPYVAIGPVDAVNDDAECISGQDISFQIDVVSGAPGFPEVTRIAGAVRKALHLVELSLTDNALVLIEYRILRRFRLPDGVRSQASITFTALVEEY